MAETERNFVSVNGIALGEETKGNTVQSIVRQLNAHTVWRSGGWQGGHHVIHDDGREMAFSHFGVGTFDGARTYLKHMVISPADLFQEAMMLEEKGVASPLDLITIDQDCISTTAFHSGISRIREILRGEDRKGTIGKGVGEAVRDSVDPELTIRAGDFGDSAKVARIAENIRRAKLAQAEDLITTHQGSIPPEIYDELEILRDETLVGLIADASKYLANLVSITDDSYLRDLLERSGSIVNEVSHGALHHPWYGFVPHVTQIDPTAQAVIDTVKSHNYKGKVSRVGIVRSYLTRHGAGPLPTYNPEMTRTLVETHNNSANDWLGEFRTGNFDIVALTYALSISGGPQAFDGLVISYLDVLSGRKEWQFCEAYEYLGQADDLNEYFYLDGNKIVGIKLHPNTQDEAHYRHQLRLTELIKNCRPILTTITAEPGKTLEEAFISYVEEKLGVPVIGKAYGPKLQDRPFLPNFDQIIRSKT